MPAGYTQLMRADAKTAVIPNGAATDFVGAMGFGKEV
jgi:hypothetical protein